jgi:zinc protease
MKVPLSAAVDRSRLPEPGPTPSVRFPRIEKATGASGLRVWTVNHPSVPVVTLMLLVRRGSADDPPGREGLAALTVDMLDEGSGGRSAIQMHETLAKMGTHLNADIGADAAVMSLTVLSRFTAPALAVLADMVATPSLTDEDFARVRQLRLHRLTQLRDVPGAIADRAFMRLLFGGHPYGHMPLGTEQALAALSVDDVRRFHTTMMRPGDATLIAVGDCAHDVICPQVAHAFARWDGAPTAIVEAAADLPSPARLNVVPRPGAPQSELRLGHVAVARNTPDYHALVAANMVLGGQFVSRINLNLRAARGITYGARTAFDFRRLPGPFALQVSVDTAATALAIAESLGEIAGIRGARPVNAPELALGVAALTRGYARNFETADQIARAVSQIALYDLPDDYFEQFVPRVQQVTPEDVTRVASRYLDPARMTALIVGDFDTIATDLAGLALGEPVVLPPETF